MQLSLIKTPNPILNSPTVPVKQVDQKVKQIVQEMKRVLNSCKNPVGVGLAATQVGLNIRIFIIKPTPKDPITCFINPKIIKSSQEIAKNKKLLEGCLSIHNTWGSVARHRTIKLEYLNEDGKAQVQKFTGWKAQIIQHELDHLNGVLFTQRALEQNNELYRIVYKKGEEEFEAIKI